MNNKILVFNFNYLKLQMYLIMVVFRTKKKGMDKIKKKYVQLLNV